MQRGEHSERSPPATLLVVEDDSRVARSLTQGLQEAGFSVQCAGTLKEAAEYLRSTPPALLLLDLALPDGDGLTFLRRLRRDGLRVPVIILTARDAIEDRVSGLDEGADDYLVKPFSFAELLARVRARLRISKAEEASPVLRIADLEIDRLHRVVRRGGASVELTAREFEVLEYLARWAGAPVSREMLTREVWKIDSRLTPMDNVIDVHISHLREKIDCDREPRLIQTLRGVGFMLAEGAA